MMLAEQDSWLPQLKSQVLLASSMPVAALGLRMDDHTLRVAVSLPQWLLHISVKTVVTKGRHHRHASVNSIIHRALTTAKFSSRLEPAGYLDLMARIEIEQH